MINEIEFKKLSVVIIIGILILLSAFVMWPILSSVIVGLLLAYIFFPVYIRITKIIKEKNTAAFLVIIISILVIFVPLWFLMPFVAKQIFDMYLLFQKFDYLSLFKSLFPTLADTDLTSQMATSFSGLVSGTVSSILNSISSLLLNLPSLALKTVVVLFVFFFGMRDGPLFKEYILSLSPFSKDTENDIIKKFEDITSSVLYGYFLVGIIQGLLTGLGLFVFGVPHATILTIVAIIGSIIPILGAWVVWIPACIYLFSVNHNFSAIALALYGLFFISWIDNVLRTYIVSRKTKISLAVILVGMIGGFLVFGFLGFVIGPLILSYLLLALDSYRKKNLPSIFSIK